MHTLTIRDPRQRPASRLHGAMLLFAVAVSSVAFAPAAMAQSKAPPARVDASSTPLPDWDRLSAAQRDMLIAPMRQRWNDGPKGRAKMYEHARRWQAMTPEQRKAARSGKKRFDRMAPEQRAQARALFDRLQGLPPEQRRALREQWKTMTPEQRTDWMRRNGGDAAP